MIEKKAKSPMRSFFSKNPITNAVVVVSFVATLVSFVELIKQFPSTRTTSLSETVVAQSQEINNLKDRLESLNQKLEKLDSSIAALSQIPNDSKAAIELSHVNGSVSEIQTKLSNLEQVVLDNPSKALGLPLLRKDLDNIKESYNSNTLSVRQEIERVYDLNKWFVGLMFTMALSILGLAISNIYKGKEKESK